MAVNNPYGTPPAAPGEALCPLPAGTHSLARHVPPGVPAGTLCVLGPRGGVQAGPGSGRVVRFGRNADEVDVVVGRDDPGVSRVHGTIAHDRRRWRLTNTGALPIRFPGSELLLSEQDEPLSTGYTPLFLGPGERGQPHVVEVLVTSRASPVGGAGAVTADGTTVLPPGWALTDVEKLVLVSLAQRYLRHAPRPAPQSWKAVVDELREVAPDVDWAPRMVQNRVLAVRTRLSRAGVEGLHSDEVEPPLGNALNHNLIMALLAEAVLVPPDLRLLDGPDPT